MEKFDLFEKEKCLVGPSHIIRSSIIFEAYHNYVKSTNASCKLHNRSFTQWMKVNRPIYKHVKKSGAMYFLGITLLDSDKSTQIEAEAKKNEL